MEADTKIFQILCQIMPKYEFYAVIVATFIKKYPDVDCSCASICQQYISPGSLDKEIGNDGVMFICENNVIFAGEQNMSNGSSLNDCLVPTFHNTKIYDDEYNNTQLNNSYPSSSIYQTTHAMTSIQSMDKRILTIVDDNHTYVYNIKNINLIDRIGGVLSFVGLQITNNVIMPKNVAMLTIGSRGDVEPFINLANVMMKKGYNVKIITHRCFENMIKSNGISFHPLSFDPVDLMKLCVNNYMMSINFMKESIKSFLPVIPSLLKDAYEGAQNANMIIATPTSLAGYHIAEALQVPFFNVFTMPYTHTNDQANVMTLATAEKENQTWYTNVINYATEVVTDQTLWIAVRNRINTWRKNELNIPAKGYFETNNSILNSQKINTLYCYSSNVYEKPADWPDNIYVTGYWRNETQEHYTPSKEVSSFLNHFANLGVKPILVSFGSVPIPNPEIVYDSIISICRSFDIPIIICTGWTTSKITSSDNILIVQEISYDFILKHVNFMIHHGGAGTTAACIYNKVPMIIMPFFGDQFFWGKRVDDLKIGKVISYKDLTQNKAESTDVHNAIRELYTYDTYQVSINRLAVKVIAENGITNAINIIEQNIAESYIPPSYKPDNKSLRCNTIDCGTPFSMMERRHHCRNCGNCFCGNCTSNYIPIKKYRYYQPVRVCDVCFSKIGVVNSSSVI